MENSEAEDSVMSFPVELGNNDHWELENRVLSLAMQTCAAVFAGPATS
jgi:hypothetical protein